MRVWEVWSAGKTKSQVVLYNFVFSHINEENVKMPTFGNMLNEKHSEGFCQTENSKK